MSTGLRMPRALAWAVADEAVALLAPFCKRLEVAGSVRRKAFDVGDIELVAIPRLGSPNRNLFGNPVDGGTDLLHEECERLLAAGVLSKRLNRLGRPAWGRRLKFALFGPDQIGLDLYSCTPEQWGVTLALRTGPAEFSTRLVTAKRSGGLCPSHLQFREWRVAARRGQKVYDTPEELDVFAALGLPYIEPESRR